MVELATRRAPAPKAAAWLKVLPPATRFSFNGDAAARAAVTPLWGAEFSEVACRAHVDSARATLWLGPDEYLLLDTVATSPESPAALFDSLENALSAIPHALVDISHGPAGRNHPKWRLPVGPRYQRIPRRHVHPYRARQSRYRALAKARRRVPPRSVALVCRLRHGHSHRNRRRSVTEGWLTGADTA
jgi:hypothetical protein